MAHIVPEKADPNSTKGELRTLEVLREELPEDFTVYHRGKWHRGELQGDIDFAVVNNDGDMLIIEQKDGAILETTEGLIARYEDGDKNVHDQIQRNVKAVKMEIGDVVSKFPNLKASAPTVDYRIYLTRPILKDSYSGPDNERILDAKYTPHHFRRRIVDILGPGRTPHRFYADYIHHCLRNLFNVGRTLHGRNTVLAGALITAHKRRFSRLNSNLVVLSPKGKGSPRRTRIKGAAGCGKTGVAIRFYEHAAQSGKRPLMICFNRPLREKLNATAQGPGLIQTWNGFCAKFLEDCGASPDYERVSEGETFWMEVETEVRERAANRGVPSLWKFGELIVDEAQDLKPDFLPILKFFLRDNSDITLLEDPDQNIRGVESPEWNEFTVMNERRNFRSPDTVAHAIRSVLPFEFECVGPSTGLHVKVWPYDAPAEQPRIAAKRVDELKRLGFGHEHVALLTMRGFGKSVFSSRRSIGNYTLKRFTGEYDVCGNQIVSGGKFVSTASIASRVRRFLRRFCATSIRNFSAGRIGCNFFIAA